MGGLLESLWGVMVRMFSAWDRDSLIQAVLSSSSDVLGSLGVSKLTERLLQ